MAEETKDTIQFEVDFSFLLDIITTNLNGNCKEPNDELCPSRDKIWEMMSSRLAPNEIRRLVLLEYEVDDEVQMFEQFPPAFYLFDHFSPCIWWVGADELEKLEEEKENETCVE